MPKCRGTLPRVGSKSASKKAGKGAGKVAKLPKKKCCVDTPKCNRCPLRMLQEGTLPSGYTVKKRKLVKVERRPTGKKAERRPPDLRLLDDEHDDGDQPPSRPARSPCGGPCP